ncbi:MAG: hypothetical protein ACI9SK_002020 [Zhongshania sp.]|jgi:hypothetical protein
MAKNENRAPRKNGLDEVANFDAGFGGLDVAIRMQQRFIGTTSASGCNSWYLTKMVRIPRYGQTFLGSIA